MTRKEQIIQKMFILKKNENYYENEVRKKNVILFLDEINTNENINGIFKEILIEKKIKGR
jgi:hypothetical protein